VRVVITQIAAVNVKMLLNALAKIADAINN
jgi:hypothetical protein